MVDPYPDLWTVPQVAKEIHANRERLSKIADHWELGVIVRGRRILLKAEAEALVWLARNPRYDGPPPWPEYRKYILHEATQKDLKLAKKYGLGIDIAGMKVFIEKDLKRMREVRKSKGRGIYSWAGSVRSPRAPLDTDRYPLYDTSKGVFNEISTVPTRTPEERRKNMARQKADKGRSSVSVYLTPELKARVEAEIQTRPWMSISAMITEIVFQYYEGVNNGGSETGGGPTETT